MDAIAKDSQNRMRWSKKGHHLALDIAKGLVYLHSNQVCLNTNLGCMVSPQGCFENDMPYFDSASLHTAIS